MDPKPDTGSKNSILATDLDGTLIPLDGNRQNHADLQTLAGLLVRHKITLMFVTGRHFQSVLRVTNEFQLPQPDWMICDVGTSIYERQASGEFTPVEQYQQYQAQITGPMPIATLARELESIAGLRIQEQEKQGRFKLSYYASAARLNELVGQVQNRLHQLSAPYSVIQSVDPFNGDGLIDLLPEAISKAHALSWWARFKNVNQDRILFAGDSGNDLAALTAGYRTIVVGNAARTVAERTSTAHREAGWKNLLYLAQRHATSGVLDGCRWFGLADSKCASEK